MSEAALTDSTTAQARSEEHTSELQSQSNLVCRLLLEKKYHLDNSRTAAPPRDTDLARDITTSSTSIDMIGLLASYTSEHTEPLLDHLIQADHEVTSSL